MQGRPAGEERSSPNIAGRQALTHRGFWTQPAEATMGWRLGRAQGGEASVEGFPGEVRESEPGWGRPGSGKWRGFRGYTGTFVTDWGT